MSSSKNEFIIALKYQNNIPSAPCGPYLKKVDMYHTFDSCSEYRTSTLEKGYVWQPHFGPDLGINLDLVDQDLILSQDKAVQQPDIADKRYLFNITDASRSKSRKIDQSAKPWWLRNTTYMENNIFNQVGKQKTDGADATVRRKGAKIMKDPFSEEAIEESFELAEKTVANLRGKKRVHRVFNILPLHPIINGESLNEFAERIHSLVRFDEDPKQIKVAAELANKDKSGDRDEHTKKKRMKVDHGIITNLREPEKVLEFKKALLPEVSMVAPLDKEIDAVTGKAADEVTEDGDAAVASVSKLCGDSAIDGTLYDWVNDYRMEVQAKDVTDCFLFLMDKQIRAKERKHDKLRTGKFTDLEEHSASSSSSAEDVAESATDMQTAENIYFFPVRARIDMRKVPYEDAKPHQCLVSNDA